MPTPAGKFKGMPLKLEVSEKDFASKITTIKNTYYNVFNNPEVLDACLKFLKDGNFK